MSAVQINVLLDFNRRLNKMASDRARAIAMLKATPVNFFIALVIAKIIKTHNAILTLCGNGYGEDAGILVRSVFEILLDVEYILKEESEKRARRYFDYSWVIKKMYLDSFVNHADATGYGNSSLNDEEKQKIIYEAARVNKEYNFKKNGWSDKNGWEMAKEVGMSADYETFYKMMCGLAHTDILALDGYAILDKDGSPKINMDPSDNYIPQILASSFEYLFKVVYKWNELLELNMSDNLKKFEEEYSTAMEKIKSQ